jgi:hypothetical protein
MVMHRAIVNARKVSAESKMLHPLKEIGVVGQYVFERTMPVTSLAHEDSTTLLQNFGINDSGIISELGHIPMAFNDCLDRRMIAIRAQ